MKILVTVDKIGSAIWELAEMNAKFSPHHEFKIVAFHPKRPDQFQANNFLEGYKWCDVWDCQYWKTGEKIREMFGDVIATEPKPNILTHHNPYDLLQKSWGHYTKNVVMNSTQQRVIKSAKLIPHAVDMTKYKWNPDYTEDKTVLMVAARIESKKGVLEVAKVCKELGYKLLLAGRISDQEYFQRVVQAGSGSVSFYEDIPEEELISLYAKSAIHVCNSVDNFESGTLPILNSMATGVPVLTRPVGLVPDIYNEKNMLVRSGTPEDTDELKALLRGLMEDLPRRKAMREEAWHSVRNYDAERRSWAYSKLYYQISFKNPVVSVIMPVFKNADKLQQTISDFDKQTYPAIELVVVSDGDEEFDKLNLESKHTVKYFRVGDYDKYGLALARNVGALESQGEILVLFDQRFRPDPTLIEEFVKNLRPKLWLFANKGTKRNFVENVSCLYRQEFIDMGMSNQLMDGYGGMSQELRERSRRQGFKHVFIEKAVATPEYASHNRSKRKEEIRIMKQKLWKMGFQ